MNRRFPVDRYSTGERKDVLMETHLHGRELTKQRRLELILRSCNDCPQDTWLPWI
jgi:hypothetical protein